MQMKKNIETVLLQLTAVLQELSDAEYTTPSSLLNNTSIGAHTRHIVELFQSLLVGYNTGTVNYDNRKRDKKIETDRIFASRLIKAIVNEMDKPNKTLSLTGPVSTENNDELMIETNFYREALYNLEHSIHHMALIRVGVKEVCCINLPEDFGVAPSTIQYKKACAQ
jgi:hypothetical protein